MQPDRDRFIIFDVLPCRIVIRIIRSAAFVIFLGCGASKGTIDLSLRQYAVIPQCVSIQKFDGNFVINSRTTISAGDSAALQDAETFNEFLEKFYHFRLKITRKPGTRNNFIEAKYDPALNIPDEGYRLTIDRDKIKITGKNKGGVFHGLETLLQFFPPGQNGGYTLPCCVIEDYPAFQWRGMHLDVSRHFFPVDFLKKYIDYIALYKMNTFHWHLTDDQGWRIEIKKYPKLTAVGSRRSGSMVGPDSDQKFDSVSYGGYYTQEQIKDVVAYARERHVTIVPEIEMPGHSLAALAAYPEYACTGGPFEVAKAWGIYEDVYCPKDSTFEFLENILSEVMALFPGDYIHIGGDEVPKTRWKNCTQCRQRMQKENLRNETELQSYFTRRIEKFVHSKNKKLIGWDEILEAGLPPHAAVMSWRGEAGGIAAARAGHFAVMSPGKYCYFDYYQGDPRNEPPAIGGHTTVEKVYSYDPIPDSLDTGHQKYILGAQGNVWTEYILKPDNVEYMAIPRMTALAEVLWTPKAKRNYDDFVNRLLAHFKLLDKIKTRYARSIFSVGYKISPAPNHDGLRIELTGNKNLGTIRYTADGSSPTIHSAEYKDSITMISSSELKMALFDPARLLGKTSSIQINYSKSTGKKITLLGEPSKYYSAGGAFTLVNGIAGQSAGVTSEWLGWYGHNAEATIDLGKKENMSAVILSCYHNKNDWIYFPKSAEVLVSDDGINFSSVRKIDAHEIQNSKGRIKIITGTISARYVKIKAENFGKIPDGAPGSGEDAWLFIDEISVE